MKMKMKSDLAKTSGTSPPRLSVSIATAAVMIEASVPTIMRLIKTGKLRAAKVNRRVFIKVSDIEKMFDANPA